MNRDRIVDGVLERVGFLRDDRSMFVTAAGPLRDAEPPEGWMPVYIVREAAPQIASPGPPSQV